MFKVNNRNAGERCEICSELTIEEIKRRHRRRCGVFIVNFEHNSHLPLVFLLHFYFQQVNENWNKVNFANQVSCTSTIIIHKTVLKKKITSEVENC